MTGDRVNDLYLGLLLNDSLDAAFGKAKLSSALHCHCRMGKYAGQYYIRGIYPNQVEVHKGSLRRSTAREVVGETHLSSQWWRVVAGYPVSTRCVFAQVDSRGPQVS